MHWHAGRKVEAPTLVDIGMPICDRDTKTPENQRIRNPGWVPTVELGTNPAFEVSFRDIGFPCRKWHEFQAQEIGDCREN